MERILGSIPVRPHLARLALVVENRLDEGFIDLGHGTFVAHQLASLLQGKIKIRKRSDQKPSSLATDHLYFRYTKRQIKQSYIAISPAHISYFNRRLHLYMYEQLHLMVLLNREKAESEVIHDFIDYFGLTDLVEYDAIKKSYYRIRKRKNLV